MPERAGGLHCLPPVHLIGHTVYLASSFTQANTAYILAKTSLLDLELVDVLQLVGLLT